VISWAQVGHHLNDFFTTLAAAAGDDNRGALTREPFGETTTDAAGASNDKANLRKRRRRKVRKVRKVRKK